MRWFFYRLIMRIAHHYNWHYAPPIYPDGDTQLWCKWCGFRQTIKYATKSHISGIAKADKINSKKSSKVRR
jgi:hypothetical protein